MSYFEIDNNPNTIAEVTTYTYSGVTVTTRDIFEHSNDEYLNSVKKNDLESSDGNLIKSKDTYYKIIYTNREPNFVHNGITPSSYIANNMYLYGILHRNISGLTTKPDTSIVGEIVIEHTNPNKQAQKIYTCFLVSGREAGGKMMDNSIDNLVKKVSGTGGDPEITVDMNSVIPKQTECIHYTDDDNHVFVFTEPILVNEDAVKFFEQKLAIETDMLKVHPPYDYEIIHLATSTKEGFVVQEGAEGEIYIDCQPTGETEDVEKAIQIPIGKEYSKHESRVDGLKTVTHVLMFITLGLIAMMVGPKIAEYINGKVDYNGISMLLFFLTVPVLAGITMTLNGYIADIDYMGEIGVGLFVASIILYYFTHSNITTSSSDNYYPDGSPFNMWYYINGITSLTIMIFNSLDLGYGSTPLRWIYPLAYLLIAFTGQTVYVNRNPMSNTV
jgi:hypothetical protein